MDVIPIAVRRYAVAGDPGRQVVLTLGKPRRDPQPGGDWMCTVLIEGAPGQRRRRIHGIDALQALQLAMLYARHRLDATKIPLTWLDGEPGDIALSPARGDQARACHHGCCQAQRASSRTGSR